MKYGRERKKVQRIAGRVNGALWDLGDALLPIWEQDMWREWGFRGWESYAEIEVGVSIRTAQQLVAVARWLGRMPCEAQEWARSERWTCLRHACSRIDESNWREWRSIIKGRTAAQIQAYLRAEREMAIQQISLQKILVHLNSINAASVEELVNLRIGGLSAEKISKQSELSLKDIRRAAPYVASFVDHEVHAHLTEEAIRNGRTVAEEIAWVLSAAYPGAAQKAS
jgi:hypothetical protein